MPELLDIYDFSASLQQEQKSCDSSESEKIVLHALISPPVMGIAVFGTHGLEDRVRRISLNSQDNYPHAIPHYSLTDIFRKILGSELPPHTKARWTIHVPDWVTSCSGTVYESRQPEKAISSFTIPVLLIPFEHCFKTFSTIRRSPVV